MPYGSTASQRFETEQKKPLALNLCDGAAKRLLRQFIYWKDEFIIAVYYRSFFENLQSSATDIACEIFELFRTAILKTTGDSYSCIRSFSKFG